MHSPKSSICPRKTTTSSIPQNFAAPRSTWKALLSIVCAKIAGIICRKANEEGVLMARSCSVAAVLFVLAFASLAAAQKTTPPKTPPLVIEKQGSFFVGGRNVYSETLSTLPNFAPTGTVTVDQMYVRYQVPVSARRYPLT